MTLKAQVSAQGSQIPQGLRCLLVTDIFDKLSYIEVAQHV